MQKEQISENTAVLCPVYKKCSGCQLMNLSYDEQLSLKQSKIIKLMGKFCHVDEIIGMSDPKHYRNKTSAVFKLTKPNNRIISGVYQSSTGGIVTNDECIIENKRSNAIIKYLRKLMPEFKLYPYDDYTGKGTLKHVMVRYGRASGEYMVVLVTATPILPKGNELARALQAKFPEIKTVVQSVSDSRDKMMLGEREKVLLGEGYITDTLCGKKFIISPRSFYQVNPVQTEKLYSLAIEMADIKKTDRVLDCYCGIGTIGLIASDKAGEVLGVESNPQAIKDAKKNAALNKVKNAGFVCSDTGKLLTSLAEEGEGANVVMLDPARAGCDRATVEALLKMMPERIVYISCNPETQERDVKALIKGGYKVKRIQPVDMFPFTLHCECIVKLERKQPSP